MGAGVTTGGGSDERSAVSLLVSQLPPGAIWCENEGPCPADMLVLFVDSNGNTCSDPTGFPSNDAVQWLGWNDDGNGSYTAERCGN